MGIIFWIISFIIVIFTIVPILIILFFGIPFTKELENKNLLKKDNNVIKKYTKSIIFLSTFFIIIAFIFYYFFPNRIPSLIGGGIFAIILSIGKLGKNKNNISDYLETNKNEFNDETIEVINNLKNNNL